MSELLKGSYKDSQGVVWLFCDELQTKECFQTDKNGRHRQVSRVHQKMVRQDNPEIFDWYLVEKNNYWY
jgi:hypothetical protein